MVDDFAEPFKNHGQKLEKDRGITKIPRSFGPSVEIRTRGLLNPIQARYQTSPHPEMLAAHDSFNIVSHLAENCKHYFRIF